MSAAGLHPYYAERKPAIVAELIESLHAAAPEFEALVPQHPLAELQPRVLKELEHVLTTLPYVGGRGGRMTPFFEQAAGFFALVLLCHKN